MNKGKWTDWILRIVKGMFIGSGFILPGVSGGALAAVFGIYERLISFLANLTKEFKKNILFFIPVGIGMLVSIFLLSFPVNSLLNNADINPYVYWFFIGCIAGTAPALMKQANKKGHKPKHYVILAVTAAVGLAFLKLAEGNISIAMEQSFFIWIMAGALIGLGIIVPGLSPSNFLLYFKLYEPMTAGIKDMNFGVIIPLALGVILCALGFSKLMNYLFSKAYTGLNYFILGIVLASTLAIVPLDFNYLRWETLICIETCLAGVALALFMSELEGEHKTEDL